MKIYRVDVTLPASTESHDKIRVSRLIRAATKSQAKAFAIKDAVEARVATQEDLLELLPMEVEECSK